MICEGDIAYSTRIKKAKSKIEKDDCSSKVENEVLLNLCPTLPSHILGNRGQVSDLDFYHA